MGRSVSHATNSVYVEYSHIDDGQEEGQEFFNDDFEWYVSDFQSQLKAAFKSVDDCDDWVGNEDHAVSGNRYVKFGISEYSGVVSIWCVPVEAEYDQNAGWEALRDNWISQIENKFRKIARNSFGESIIKLGSFSNGEGVFQARAAA